METLINPSVPQGLRLALALTGGFVVQRHRWGRRCFLGVLVCLSLSLIPDRGKAKLHDSKITPPVGHHEVPLPDHHIVRHPGDGLPPPLVQIWVVSVCRVGQQLLRRLEVRLGDSLVPVVLDKFLPQSHVAVDKLGQPGRIGFRRRSARDNAAVGRRVAAGVGDVVVLRHLPLRVAHRGVLCTVRVHVGLFVVPVVVVGVIVAATAGGGLFHHVERFGTLEAVLEVEVLLSTLLLLLPRFDDVEGIDDGVPRQRTRAAVERAGRAHIGAVQSNRRFVLMRGTHCD